MLPSQERSRPGAEAASSSNDQLTGGSLHIVAGSSDTATDPEFATIGAVVQAVAAVQDDVLSIVADADFADPRCQFAIGVVRRMRTENLPVDMVTIVGYVNRHALRGGGMRVNLASWLHEMTCAAPVPASAPWYADEVVEEAARRAAQHAATAIAAAAEGDSLSDLLALVTGELTAVTAAIERVGGGVNV